jgi:hypothetical protein
LLNGVSLDLSLCEPNSWNPEISRGFLRVFRDGATFEVAVKVPRNIKIIFIYAWNKLSGMALSTHRSSHHNELARLPQTRHFLSV